MPPAFALSQDQTLRFISKSPVTQRPETNRPKLACRSSHPAQAETQTKQPKLFKAFCCVFLRDTQQLTPQTSLGLKPKLAIHPKPSQVRDQGRHQRIPSIQMQFSKSRGAETPAGWQDFRPDLSDVHLPVQTVKSSLFPVAVASGLSPRREPGI